MSDQNFSTTPVDPLVARLRELDTESISDALDSMGVSDRLLADVQPLWPSRRIAGRVVPVRLVEVGESTVTPVSHLGTRAVDASSGDDVIVVDNGGRTWVAGWGGLLSRAAGVRGIAGVVVHGAVRDVAEAQQCDFPVYGTARVPRTARGRVVEVEATSLVLGATSVDASDYVIADPSGVIVVPGGIVDEVLTRAEQIFTRETNMARAIDAGVPVTDVMNGNYEQMLDDLSS